MCPILEVSRSGYYSWRKQAGKSERKRRCEKIIEKIKRVFNENRKVYGSRKIKNALKNEGEKVSRKRVQQIMRAENLIPITVRKYKATTNSKHNFPVAENLLKNKKVTKLKEVWVTDITYINTEEGWLYLATVEDIYNKEIVGYAMGDRINTDLTIRALEEATRRQGNPVNVLHHSDRGVQYANYRYQDKLKELGMKCSMSRKGNPYDNACMESFNSILKKELIYPNKRWESRESAYMAIFEYIEVFYNRKRIHSSIGYLSPVDYRNKLELAS